MKSPQPYLDQFNPISSNLIPAGFGVALLAFTLIVYANETAVLAPSVDWL